jgi:hypothetical protein
MVKSYSKHWPCLFPQHGPGRKHHRKIELREWQKIIVRESPRIRERPVPFRWLAGRFCGAALDLLGVAWRYSRRNSISVARREAVARPDQFAGPKY